MIVKQPTKSK
ncbi:hypothetical protein ZEAMMB73_Zm00001d039826 [Zea mays]|uniref:Uncharacterized protein n=1 Tax=Zea mays TaxID=4577 RepID=A0A1D6ML93_MAIZE|nr:hypothetical protein ZEAMMB73_Zm00001d039826 [Zea mays]